MIYYCKGLLKKLDRKKFQNYGHDKRMRIICHNCLDIEDKGGCKEVDTKFKAVISGDKRRDESFHAYGVNYGYNKLPKRFFFAIITTECYIGR